METFQQRKDLITSRAKSAQACSGEYSKAIRSNTDGELLAVIKDNFNWCTAYKVIDLDTLKLFPEADLVAAGIYISGFHRAYGNATVRADGNATVEADGNATVRADGNATVRAYGNATVRADGNANLFIYNGKEVKLEGFSIARYAPYWGANSTRIQVAIRAKELIQVDLPQTPVQP
ncbi:hypothetical protein [Spirosoma sp. 48-14]|uniref:hypothetical protein n=1 Tax=Spirosoma sp. 48-14 TaxID=1895854 RepID=UPI0009696F05|nr:hypothetical protein [Spirosoma sp. 48-14]OJW77206.1 MAG: hypothetical protein BGO59_31630 [Spirosoma sp. 48-14]